ncbi:arsenate reductase (glutaredoxin) [Zavarzinia compransoris]|uniref:arsenate reductase (glutaredoxin) n=1 Tax=Zavarzinia marina TaxID=2911065 RepID=UPI001EECD629|nr:arsenate reductase (glutaredoxin) [Zavarzinia marina]MCF4164069.1 arsenate reductase (glutaredoxin) [Zavarzinia marina]
MTVTIYHNPKCGTSRTTLQRIRAAGIEPVVVDYLKTPPTRAELARLAEVPGLGAKALLRAKEALAKEMGLATAADGAILDAIAEHPILLNRPIVVTPKGGRATRPPETVDEIL